MHWLHLLNFSPLCLFKCKLKWPNREEVNSHWLHLFRFLHCAFSNESSNGLFEKMHSHIDCIFLIQSHCQSFPSRLSNLRLSNQSHNLQEFVPMPQLVVICPNGCFKLSQILWLTKCNFCMANFHFFMINVGVADVPKMGVADVWEASVIHNHWRFKWFIFIDLEVLSLQSLVGRFCDNWIQINAIQVIL